MLITIVTWIMNWCVQYYEYLKMLFYQDVNSKGLISSKKIT